MFVCLFFVEKKKQEMAVVTSSFITGNTQRQEDARRLLADMSSCMGSVRDPASKSEM